MAKKTVKNDGPQLTARCLMDHTWILTPKQVEDARSFGCAMCPQCGNAATIEKVAAKIKR